MIRITTPASAFRSSFLTHLRAVDPDAAVSSAEPMRQYIDTGLSPRSFNLGIFAAFSLGGALLAVIGVYGLVSYAVSQRRSEIGLRMAVGATEQDIGQMILREAATLGLTGAMLGGGIAAIAQPLLTHLAEDVSIPFLPAATIASLLLVLVTIAALPPARRAARISPALAMKQE